MMLLMIAEVFETVWERANTRNVAELLRKCHSVVLQRSRVHMYCRNISKSLKDLFLCNINQINISYMILNHFNKAYFCYIFNEEQKEAVTIPN